MAGPGAPPPPPYRVLALAVLFPGVGHVMAGQPRRGLTFAFATLLFALLTAALADPHVSFVGRHAGGFFVWALSIPDAYRIARVNAERWRGAARLS